MQEAVTMLAEGVTVAIANAVELMEGLPPGRAHAPHHTLRTLKTMRAKFLS